MQTWKLGGMDYWISGGLMYAWRRGGVDNWTSASALQVYDVEGCRYGVLEARCRSAGVATWRMELWRRAVSIAK